MPTTADTPKCFAQIQGKRMLDWGLEAFAANGINEICFIGGYQIDKVRSAYPQFAFRHNLNWENNNILASLMYAKDLMDEPFICSYSDVLFTADVVKKLLASGIIVHVLSYTQTEINALQPQAKMWRKGEGKSKRLPEEVKEALIAGFPANRIVARAIVENIYALAIP